MRCSSGVWRDESDLTVFATDRANEDLLRHQTDTGDMADMMLDRVPEIGRRTHPHIDILKPESITKKYEARRESSPGRRFFCVGLDTA